MIIKKKSVNFIIVFHQIIFLLGCNPLTATSTPTTLPTQPSAIPVQLTTAIPTGSQNDAILQATIPPVPDYFSKSYPLSDNGFVIPLTVRHITGHSATLFFELRNPQSGMLVYRSINPDIYSQGEVSIPTEETRHMITLEGLYPAVSYQSMVLVDHGGGDFQQPGFSKKEWGVVSFDTMIDTEPLRVGILGDASFGDQATYSLITLMAKQDLDFVIHTGDVVYETDGSDLRNSYLLKFFEPFSSLLHVAPVYTVLGNHDYDAALRWQGAPFYDYAFPPFTDLSFSYPVSRRANQYYAFAYQDIQFLMLDSQVFYGVEGRAEQDGWLKERLADPRYKFTIPVFHVAPYSSSVVHPDDSIPVRYSWVPLFEGANVPISFSGHFHHYERLVVNGVTYIVTGGGSSTLYAQGNPLPESRIYARRTHFVLMEVFRDRIEIRAITKEGETIDQVTIPLE